MPSLKIAGVDVSAIQVGSTDVQSVYIGETEIWSGKPTYLINNGYDSKRTYTTPQYSGDEPYYDRVQYGYRATSAGTLGPFGSFSSNGKLPLVNGKGTFPFGSNPGASVYIQAFYNQTKDYSTSAATNETKLILQVQGNLGDNSGWTSITNGSQTVYRTDATYSYAAGGRRQWVWTNTSGYDASIFLFGSSGTADIVVTV